MWSNLKAHHYRDDLTRPSDIHAVAGANVRKEDASFLDF